MDLDDVTTGPRTADEGAEREAAAAAAAAAHAKAARLEALLLRARALRALGNAQLAARGAALRAATVAAAATAATARIAENASKPKKPKKTKAEAEAEKAAADAPRQIGPPPGPLSLDDAEALGLGHNSSFTLRKDALELLGLHPSFGPMGAAAPSTLADAAAAAAADAAREDGGALPPCPEMLWDALADRVDSLKVPRAWLAVGALQRAVLAMRMAAGIDDDSGGGGGGGGGGDSDSDDGGAIDAISASEHQHVVSVAEEAELLGLLAEANAALGGVVEGYAENLEKLEEGAAAGGGGGGGGGDEERRKSVLGREGLSETLGAGWDARAVSEDMAKLRASERKAREAAGGVASLAGVGDETGDEAWLLGAAYGPGVREEFCEVPALARQRAPRRAAAYFAQQVGSR